MIVTVSISGASENLLLFTERPLPGMLGKYPSRFVEIRGKLFYWFDPDYPLTEEAIAVFKKFGVFPTYNEYKFEIPDISTDDRRKGATYFFCRNNLFKFKRVITNKGRGSYDPPKLDCDSN